MPVLVRMRVRTGGRHDHEAPAPAPPPLPSLAGRLPLLRFFIRPLATRTHLQLPQLRPDYLLIKH